MHRDGAPARGLGYRLHGCNWKELLRGELSGWEMNGAGDQDAKEPFMLVPAGRPPALRIRASDHIAMRERQGRGRAEQAGPGAAVYPPSTFCLEPTEPGMC